MSRYIRFDWAAKHILRDKADFVVFEGLISSIIGQKMTIIEMLESESNQETRDDKYNRVDIKAKNEQGEIILVEIQQTRELDYLQRMLYGVAKAITEHIAVKAPYSDVKKVYSINILYFNIGEGEDYLYHGQTVLKGVHTGDILRLTDHERNDLNVLPPENVFPDYYIIRVDMFNKPKLDNYLEEWMDYLKNERINPDTKAPGLKEASERLDRLKMTEKEQREYWNYIDTLKRDTDVEKTKLLEAEIAGRKKGLEEGRVQGLEEGRVATNREHAVKMKTKGLPDDMIAEITGLSLDEIRQLKAM